MKLKVNEKDEIVAYADCGDIDDSIEYDDSVVPDDFFTVFKPSFYLLKDNEVVINPNYQEPTVGVPETPPGPSPEMLAINALGVQVAKLMAEKGGA